MKALGLVVGALVLVTVGWLALMRAVPAPIEAAWIDGMYRQKKRAARLLPSPKVVLIGGSGTHYSYLASVVSARTGRTVVNLGTHAGLGTDYLLWRARKSLRSGDIGVLILEHQLIHAAPAWSILSMFVLSSDSRYLVHAPGKDVLPPTFGYPPVQVARQASMAALARTSPFNRAETVTLLGDESVNTPENKQPYIGQIVHALPSPGLRQIDPDAPPAPLASFVDWARNHEVRLVHAWPTTTFRAEYLTVPYAT